MAYSVQLDAEMEGLSGEILLNGVEDYSRIHINFSVRADGKEDIPIIWKNVKEEWTNILTFMELKPTGFYNYEVFPVSFQVISSHVMEDIPVVFSVMLATKTYTSYIMQKPHCVVFGILGITGDLELLDWNVFPNRTWYVRTEEYDVFLFDNESDMASNINPVAAGVADSNTLQVVLRYVYQQGDEYDEYDEIIMYDKMEYYYQDFEYHLSLSEVVGVRYFKIKPFADMCEIRHPIYNNPDIVLSRGQAELDLHTFTVLGRELTLGTHTPEMEVGEAVRLVSARRGITEDSQILSQTIRGDISNDGTTSLINTIRVANYTELHR